MAENLVLRLIARTSAFERGMGKATKRTRMMNAAVGGLGRTMRRMAGAALAAAGIGGIGYLVKQQMAAIDANAKLSDRIGITTENLVGLQHGAQIMGVETATLNKSLEIFTKRLGEVTMGTGEADRALEALGLSADELINKSPDQAIGIIADQIERLETQAEKAAAANFLFGRSGQQLLNLFAEGSQGIAKYRMEVEELGLAYSRTDAAKVEEANDAITRMQGAVTGMATELAVTLGPAIESLTNTITSFLKRWNELKDIGGTFQAGITSARLVEVNKLIEKSDKTREFRERRLAKMREGTRGHTIEKAAIDRLEMEWSNLIAERRLLEAELGYERIKLGPRRPDRQPKMGNKLLLVDKFLAQTRAQQKAADDAVGTDGASAIGEITDSTTPERIEKTTDALADMNMTLDVNKLKWQSVAWTMENAMVSAMEAVEFEGQNLEKSMKDIARAVLVEMQRVFIFQRTAQAATGFLSGLGGSIMSKFRTPSTGPGLTPGQFSPYTPGEQFTPAFASGGITDRPSIFGEGSMKEAAVPLPDGRTIPVTMKGGGSPNIQIINQGTNQTVTDSDSIMENGQMFLRIWTDDYVNEGLTFDAVSNSRGFG